MTLSKEVGQRAMSQFRQRMRGMKLMIATLMLLLLLLLRHLAMASLMIESGGSHLASEIDGELKRQIVQSQNRWPMCLEITQR